MIVFGKIFREKLDEHIALQIVSVAHSLVATFQEIPMGKIIQTLDLVGQAWKPGSHYYQQALEMLPRELKMSGEMLAYSLNLIHPLLSASNLQQRLLSELGDAKFLDDFHWSTKFPGKMRAFPRGTLFHVTAGNIFLGGIDSLLMGLLTKNISMVKLSGRNQMFPHLFAQSILEIDTENIIANKFALLYWPHQQLSIQSIFQKQVDTIIAWGGDEMLQAYGKNLGKNTKLISYGPKISVQVLAPNNLPQNFSQLGKLIAQDLALWDQQACASPQNLFFPATHLALLPNLLEAIGQALENYPLPRRQLSADEEVELWKEKSRGEYFRLMAGGEEKRGKDYYLYFDPICDLRPTALNRCLVIRPYTGIEELALMMKKYRYHLQSCGYWAHGQEKEELLRHLSGAGVKRFAPLGQMLTGMTGAPHDGRYGLQELINLVPDETTPIAALAQHLEDIAQQVPYYRQLSLPTPRELASWPLMNGEKLTASFFDLLHPQYSQEGRIYSSGGTSGRPKYCFYTEEEFEKISALLAQGFRRLGVYRGMTVANLFTPGNLWSAFSFVERALAICQTRQLPIGGLTDYSTLINYLQNFRPQAIWGLPSLLVSYANFCVQSQIKLEIPQIFYAGEHLSPIAQEFLQQTWHTQHFFSAGHASVDGGVIGYQCPCCLPGEHHLFADDVHLEIVDGEGIITSTIRRALPVIRYQTGDHLTWVDSGQKCACGSTDPKYLLHGRIDSMVNIWACKINSKDLDKTLADLDLSCLHKQIHLKQQMENNQLIEYLEIFLDRPAVDSRLLIQRFYENCRDVKTTFSLKEVTSRIKIHADATELMVKNSRTGKIPLIIDYRH